MSDDIELTDDQLAQVEATLKRLRGGLAKYNADLTAEPAHRFIPEAADEPN